MLRRKKVAKSKVNIVRTVVIQLEEGEAHYLHGVLQNPVHDGDDQDDERVEIWKAIDSALRTKPNETL